MSKNDKKEYSLTDYIEGIKKGDITVLSKAITLVESQNAKHTNTARRIVESCLPASGNSVRIGITGIPGVGKSSFIDSFGSYLIKEHNKKVAVLAVDPSSENSKGSVLGDKVRMVNLSNNRNAYIRPTAAAGSVGGVARKTRETIFLCEAAGFDTVIIETMGVGQAEYAVHSMVDFFLLLLIAGTGDDIQGIKRGIMEMADGFAINKCDNENVKNSMVAKKQLENVLRLLPKKEAGWQPKALVCSSLENSGIDEVWKLINGYEVKMKASDNFQLKRKEQAKMWIHQEIKERLKIEFYNNKKIKANLREAELKVMEGEISSYTAANKLLKSYFNRDG